MTAELERSGYDADADTIKTSETRSTAADRTYDVDPDNQAYASGNDPESAHRDQGRPDSPNGWTSHASQDHDDSNAQDHAETADHEAEQSETDGTSRSRDLWGDTDPDTANYADLDDGTRSPDGQDNLQHADLTADRDADNGPPDQPRPADTEQAPSPEQQRISTLEAENADARQRIADANQRIAELEAKNDEQSGRLDRIEQLLAGPDKNPVDPGAEEHGDDKPSASAEHQTTQDAAVSARKASAEGRDARDAERRTWRRIPSAENVGLASTVLGAADTVAQFAMHAAPEGIVGLGATALGLTSIGLAKFEKKRKENERA